MTATSAAATTAPARTPHPVTETLSQTWYMTQRQLMAILRQPAFLAITLVQPVIWLYLFGSLFRKVVELPGFGMRLLSGLPGARRGRDERAVLQHVGGHGHAGRNRTRNS